VKVEAMGMDELFQERRGQRMDHGV